MTKELQNYVWQKCLPKEFKEEVKNYYEHTDSCSREEDVLESIFGEHNLLTSDAEGEEDEMLCVSRKDMQFYYQYYKAKRESELSAEQKAYYKGRTKVLLDLFGSKCLLDEACNVASSDVASSEANVDSSEHLKPKANSDFTPIPEKTFISKWDKAEPKPAEPDEKDDCKKFTKRLDDTLEGEIKEPFKEWYDKKYSNVEKLEKNGEVEPKPAEPKFKVGDKVRYKEFVGTVYQIEETDYVIRKLAGGDLIGWLKESDLEPYTEPTNEDFVTLGVESAEYLRKSLEESEYRNSSQNIENCDKHFDNILKDGFSKERRLNIAAMVMQGIMANPNPQMVEMDVHRVADLAILMADTLIAECEKGTDNLGGKTISNPI